MNIKYEAEGPWERLCVDDGACQSRRSGRGFQKPETLWHVWFSWPVQGRSRDKSYIWHNNLRTAGLRITYTTREGSILGRILAAPELSPARFAFLFFWTQSGVDRNAKIMLLGGRLLMHSMSGVLWALDWQLINRNLFIQWTWLEIRGWYEVV